MNVKFRITFTDGTTGESHDDMWNHVRDHAHFLPPHCDKQWVKYEIIGDNGGLYVSVDFFSGVFNINGQSIHPGSSEGMPLTGNTEPQKFPVNENWAVLNGLPYFPVVGRRNFMTDHGSFLLYFCGWKKNFNGNVIQKIVFTTPEGKMMLA